MNTPFPKSPRFEMARANAYGVFKALNIHTMPIDIFRVFKELQLSIQTYAQHAKKLQCSIKDIINIAGSEDGVTIYNPTKNKYITLYNDSITTIGRINWTLAHELGHIRLHHLQDFKQTQLCRHGINDEQYSVLEKEANCFASELLCSPALIRLFPSHTWTDSDLSSIFNISHKAAELARKKLARNPSLYEEYSMFLRKQFQNFLASKYCLSCHHYFIDAKAKHCPICNSTQLVWGNFNQIKLCFLKNKYKGVLPIMHYDLYKAEHLTCPRCGNEDLKDNYRFCPICGLPTQNTCIGIPGDKAHNANEQKDGCGHELSATSRYCPYCGGYSNYFYLDVIPDWKTELKEVHEEKHITQESISSTDNIPF